MQTLFTIDGMCGIIKRKKGREKVATKYYAVKCGRVPGIYTTWAECKEQTDGFSGAEYKSFAKKTEAKEYLGIEVKKKLTPPAPNTKEFVDAPVPYEISAACAFYVDGSYNVTTGEYAFGAVMLKDGKIAAFSHKYNDDAGTMRNVAGEIAGALFAMRYAVQLKMPSVEIYYDYEGIEKWATGKWKTNLDRTRAYAETAKAAAKYIDIRFIKVKGHSGDTYNDMADRLAKDELGIK